ncbi:uncharacterized protein LOC107472067 [Arachis duranensis]|uniref:Uncharacterized protein LOC107472067 n=1 Tax=Arachis duranensis TaxID=130453 RepID=A0A6P4BW49_ARADU|nr:uncharacterized protein LOC107472067 [Arachis duranensis]
MCDASNQAIGAALAKRDEFDIEIKDQSESQNLVADHLSRLENLKSDLFPINDSFPLDSLHAVSDNFPWFAPMANYLVAKFFPPNFSKHQRDKLRSDSKYYILDDPHLWKRGVDQWVEAIPTRLDDANTVISFIRNYIVYRYVSPRAIVSDQGSHFCNKKVEALLKRYGVVHKVATAYHPQTNGQAKVSNREIKRILEKVVSPQRKDWSLRLGDAL